MVCTRRNLGVYLACLGSDAPASAQNDVLHGAASNQGRGRFTSARACLLLPLLVLELHHSSSSCSVFSYSLYDSACEETQASRLFPACSLTSYSKNTTSIRPRVVCACPTKIRDFPPRPPQPANQLLFPPHYFPGNHALPRLACPT